MDRIDIPKVTLLPAQWRRLAELADQDNHGAIGVSQDGSSTVRIFTGHQVFDIDARGNVIHNPDQENLC